MDKHYYLLLKILIVYFFIIVVHQMLYEEGIIEFKLTISTISCM